ncbi:MAG TPA: NeuD/PglB/VioB family sugar acetyltransferase [Aromatoleum sp.]|uniref:NeuD/PglB/VioB family sugar acetyltransferase n=1 Tax=Aromatoleum sp. TaxID=2307007 RepID=UPI002B493A34|nr:NeuD/PglB/VioB family sugar acetyltransferase [Aromatoleum sp.]HJV25105.1 NeuD/PglB/VioB family sugar acetyltransferase [Aromatoleum sp.]
MDVLIVGAGGHGRSVAEAILLGGTHRVIGFFDDAWPDLKDVCGCPVLGKLSELKGSREYASHVIVAIGNNAIRERLYARILASDLALATVVHPKAIVSPRAVLGAGCAVMAGAVVGTEARLGQGVIVNCNATVDHQCIVNDFGHLGVNACMAGGAVLGRGAWMQAGSALGYGVVVPAESVLIPGESRV